VFWLFSVAVAVAMTVAVAAPPIVAEALPHHDAFRRRSVTEAGVLSVLSLLNTVSI
jgi:hypothetical protein